MIRDEVMQKIMEGSPLTCQRYQPVIVYFNGEYWGIHNLRDRVDVKYFAEKYDVKKDSITILENGPVLISGLDRSRKKFNKFLNDLNKGKIPDAMLWDSASSYINIESFTDFVISNVFFANGDWPSNNTRLWKIESSQDSMLSKWNWILFDTDYGFGYMGSDAVNADLFNAAFNIGDVGKILRGMFRSPQYRDYFLKRFDHHLNTTFQPDRMISIIDNYSSRISKEIPYHLSRWRVLYRYSSWENQVDQLRKFAKERPVVIKQQLRSLNNKYSKS
jgi:anaerobic selenocysteine-containing dehydrogenase